MEPKPEVAAEARLAAVGRMLEIVDRLRDPGGCPWDREQTVESMAPYAVEEAHELREAIESGDTRSMVEEAGDCLMSVSMIARIASEHGTFDLIQACEAVSDKLVRRHPHVFSDGDASTSGEVLETWEEIKKQERAGRKEDTSALAGVPRTLPALQRAGRVSEKAVAAGFAWENADGAYRKLGEELAELDAVIGVPSEPLTGERKERVEHELGDVLSAGAFLAQYLGLDPERLCGLALDRFATRFRHMESECGGDLSGRSLDELMQAWSQAKRATK